MDKVRLRYQKQSAVGRYLQTLREKHGYSAEELAKKINRDITSLKWVEQRGRFPRVEFIRAFSSVYNMSFDKMYETLKRLREEQRDADQKEKEELSKAKVVVKPVEIQKQGILNLGHSSGNDMKCQVFFRVICIGQISISVPEELIERKEVRHG